MSLVPIDLRRGWTIEPGLVLTPALLRGETSEAAASVRGSGTAVVPWGEVAGQL